jgi:1-deoxy-D-xylulose-5-phosphate synthase
MLYTAVYDVKGPVAMRYPRGSATGKPLREKFESVPIGKGDVLREGDDIAILAVGNMVAHSLKAAELLENSGVRATVVNMRFIKPLDTALLDELMLKHRILLTVEDNSIVGGFGSAVAEYVCGKTTNRPVVHLHGLPDDFIDHGTQEELHRDLNLDPLGIARTAGALVGVTLASAMEQPS